MSGRYVDRKLEGSSGESEWGASGARVDIVAGLIVLGADAVAVAAVAARASDRKSGVRCYRAAREEI